MFNCQDARMACYLVFQSALKQLIVEFARIIIHKYLCKIIQLFKMRILITATMHENQLGSSEMLTINLHGIGRHTRRLGPGISIYLKSVGCSISSLDYTDVQST